LARQVEQPHKLARLILSFLLFVVVLDRFDRWLAHDGRQFVSNSWELVRWGQYAEMRDAQRAIWVFGV
jgi:hypothetical protein